MIGDSSSRTGSTEQKLVGIVEARLHGKNQQIKSGGDQAVIRVRRRTSWYMTFPQPRVNM